MGHAWQRHRTARLSLTILTLVYSGIFDAESGFLLNGTAAWTNSLPVHSYNPPFIQIGSNEIKLLRYEHWRNCRYVAIKNNLNVGNTRATTDITRLSLGTSSGQGWMAISCSRPTTSTTSATAASRHRPLTSTLLRPILMATTAQQPLAVRIGRLQAEAIRGMRSLTARSAGAMQLLGASYMQLGTTSAHQLLFLTNGTGRWAINSSGHFIVDSGSLTIGPCGGQSPDNRIRFDQLERGTPGVSTGSLVFGNSTNINTLTIQSGVTSSSITYTLPTADGSNGQCLKTNGSGVYLSARVHRPAHR